MVDSSAAHLHVALRPLHALALLANVLINLLGNAFCLRFAEDAHPALIVGLARVWLEGCGQGVVLAVDGGSAHRRDSGKMEGEEEKGMRLSPMGLIPPCVSRAINPSRALFRLATTALDTRAARAPVRRSYLGAVAIDGRAQGDAGRLVLKGLLSLCNV